SALFARSPFYKRGDFRNALAQVASVCQFFLVDTWRCGARGRARTESSDAADDDHLLIEQSRKDCNHCEFLTIGVSATSHKRSPYSADNISRFSSKTHLGPPVAKKCLDLPRDATSINRRTYHDRISR